MSISVVPEQVFELPELSELNISNNLLSALPYLYISW
jgi:Leucine-rich repeat (LRR) protein